ncbi:hypothetical protein H4Q26_011585 [Puccinia striiformis f. sp. tritici PST-130]|nr:hypothetical protein H4Q26_011585 [Puccinia striiformis f. sp. tritici PST-130]
MNRPTRLRPLHPAGTAPLPSLRELTFLSDLESATSFCERPSTHRLHSAFFADQRSIEHLYPLFSPSKPQGFADILIPSYYHYSPRAEFVYESDFKAGRNSTPADLPWNQKGSKIYWHGKLTRGADTPPGHMSSFQKQRLVKLISNDTGSTGSLSSTAHKAGETDPSWRSETSRVLVSLNVSSENLLSVSAPATVIDPLMLDIAMACDPKAGECHELLKQGYHIQPPAPLSECWKAKMTLDLDDAGFSPRFSALMESRSAVVKMSVHQEFWRDWVQPWYHFIPLSSSYAELHNLLSFFMGIPDLLKDQMLPIKKDSQREKLSKRSVIPEQASPAEKPPVVEKPADEQNGEIKTNTSIEEPSGSSNSQINQTISSPTPPANGQPPKVVGLDGFDADDELRKIGLNGRDWKLRHLRHEDMEIFNTTSEHNLNPNRNICIVKDHNQSKRAYSSFEESLSLHSRSQLWLTRTRSAIPAISTINGPATPGHQGPTAGYGDEYIGEEVFMEKDYHPVGLGGQEYPPEPASASTFGFPAPELPPDNSAGGREATAKLYRTQTSAEAWSKRQKVNRTRAKTIKIKLHKGNFIHEYPVPTPIKHANLMGGHTGVDNEFTHMRYTAVTCDPDDFTREAGWSLRPQKYGRDIELLVAITYYNEDKVLVARTLHGVMTNLKDVCKAHWSEFKKMAEKGSPESGTGAAWKKIAVVLVFDGIEPADKAALDLLATLGVYQDGVMKKEVDGKETQAHVFEYTTMLSVTPKLQLISPHENDADNLVPVQMTFVLKQKMSSKHSSIHPRLEVKTSHTLMHCRVNHDIADILDKPLDHLSAMFQYSPALSLPTALGQFVEGRWTSISMGMGIFKKPRTESCASNWWPKRKKMGIGYVKAAKGETDVPESAAELIGQRRRWLNGSFAAGVYALANFPRMYRTWHNPIRLLFLHVQAAYTTVGLIMSWFSLANWYVTFAAIIDLVHGFWRDPYAAGGFQENRNMKDPFATPGGTSAEKIAWVTMQCWAGTVLDNTAHFKIPTLQFFTSTYPSSKLDIQLALVCLQIILALGNRPKGEKQFRLICYLPLGDDFAFCPIDIQLDEAVAAGSTQSSVFMSTSYGPIFAGLAGLLGYTSW